MNTYNSSSGRAHGGHLVQPSHFTGEELRPTEVMHTHLCQWQSQFNVLSTMQYQYQVIEQISFQWNKTNLKNCICALLWRRSSCFFFFLNKICKGIYNLCINSKCWEDGSFHDNFTCFPKLLWMRLRWVSLPPHWLPLPSGFLLKESSFDSHWKLLPLLCHLACTWGFDEKIPLLL